MLQLSRIQFQEMLNELNLFRTPEEATLVDRYKHWLTGSHDEESNTNHAQINFLIELKYQKNGKGWIFKERYDISTVGELTPEVLSKLEIRFFSFVVKSLISKSLKFN